MHEGRFAVRTRSLAVIVAVITIGGVLATAFATPQLHLAELHFNPFALISLVTLLINAGLFLYFVSRPARTEERTWLALYLGIVVLYTVAELMQRLSLNPHAAAFWLFFGTPITAVPPAIFLFTLAYTNQSERRFPGLAVTLLLGSMLLGFFYTYTNLVFSSDPKLALVMPWGFDFRQAIGPAVAFSLLWNDLLLILGISRLISFRRHTRNALLRRQSLLFIFAVSVPLASATITNIVLPAAGFTNVIPLGPVLAIPAGLLLIYGVLRYQLVAINPTLFSDKILGLIQESIIVTDHNFNVAYMNPRAEALLDVKSAGGTGQLSLLRAVNDDSTTAFETAFANSKEKGDVIDIERINVNRHHEAPLPMRVLGSRLQSSDLDMWVLALSDITRELQTRSIIEHEVVARTKELHQARAYLVSSINSLEQGFVLVNHKRQIELVNARAAQLFGVHAEALTGQLLTEVASTAAWTATIGKAIEAVFASKRHKRLDISGDAGTFLQAFITPIIEGDQQLGATVIIADVTEEKILERSKDEFFSIASHELRTPLTAMRGNMSMLRDYFPEIMKNDSVAPLIDDTHDASVRLIEIVNDFLDTSQLEQDKMQFDTQPTDVKAPAEAAASDLKTLLAQTHGEIKLDGLHGKPKVLVDPSRLRQIFYNLLSNALKYGDHPVVTLSAETKEHKLLVRISDNGKGISPEGQRLLFRKFQQAGDSILTRDNTKGTGLGLYISRLLARKMGGTVELERTEVGKGTTFLITLPIAPK